MSLSIISYFYRLPKKFAHFWLYVIGIIFFPLTLAGFDEAGIFSVDILTMWWIRMVAGVLAVGGLLYYLFSQKTYKRPSLLQFYHLNGFASDGMGALILFIVAPALFGVLGFEFHLQYYLVFGFMGFVGILHFIGLYRDSHLLAWLTSLARLITGTVFFSLYYIGSIDNLGLLVGIYDISYALIYLLFRSRL
jgi:hypothetical protein